MSEPKSEPHKLVIKKLRPTIFIARNKKITVLPNKTTDLATKCLNAPLYTEQLIFSTINKNPDLKKGDFRSLILKNQLHKVTKHSRTVAYFVTHDNRQIQKTSDKITTLIGKKNYDDLFVALCSVISQELKVKAILALLTENTQQESEKSLHRQELKSVKDSACQTHEISKDIFYKQKVRPKRRVTPIVVSDLKKNTPNRVIINPCDMAHQQDLTPNMVIVKTQSFPELPHLHLDEDSNGSVMSTSHLSICSDVLNTEVRKLISVTANNIKREVDLEPECEATKIPKTDAEEFVDKFNPSTIVTLDGSRIEIPVKPEDQFHLATPEILKHITSEERKKLLWHQAYIDWKLCLERDEDGNMPLHLAVVHNDVEVIRRQCLVLRARGHTVDALANGATALEMSIKNHAAPECTRTLLECGACPLRCDSEERAALHQAAASGEPRHLREVLAAMTRRAREIVEDSEELQCLGVSDETDNAELARHLIMHASVQYDIEGYTPLILAARAGNPEMVAMLASAAPQTINTGMPNSGSTALYNAVAEACLDAIDRGNKAKVSDSYQKTIEILIENGADPEIENHNGSKVSDLLQEFNITSLSLIIAQKVTSKFYDGETPSGPEKFMLLKDPEGKLTLLTKVVSNRIVEREMRLREVTNGDQSKRQGNARRGKQNAVPTTVVAQRKRCLVPEERSFAEKDAKKGVFRFVSPDFLLKPRGRVKGAVDRKPNSPPLLDANCIIIKNEVITDPLYTEADVANGVVGNAPGVANLAEHNAELVKSPKRSAFPGNAILPELSVTEKCAKRRSRVFSAEKDRGDGKKLKV